MNDDHESHSGQGDGNRLPDIHWHDVLGKIGSGAAGTIYLVRRQKMSVALRAAKVLDGKDNLVQRELEALNHVEASEGSPYIIAIHYVGELDGGCWYYLMDAVDHLDDGGKMIRPECAPGYRAATAQALIEHGPQTIEDCIRWMKQLFAALAHLHERNLVHRDVKPSNTFFVNGSIKLGDLGMLTLATHATGLAGTLSHLPRDRRPPMALDVYAAALVIYQLVTRRLPPANRPGRGDFPLIPAELRNGPATSRRDRRSLRRLGSIFSRMITWQAAPRYWKWVPFRWLKTALNNWVSGPAHFDDARQVLRELKRQERAPFAAVAGVIVLLLVGIGVGHVLFHRTPLPVTHVNFITRKPYFEAEILIDGVPWEDADHNRYHTPCSVPNFPAKRAHVMFHKDGLQNLDLGEIDFTHTTEVERTTWSNAEPHQ